MISTNPFYKNSSKYLLFFLFFLPLIVFILVPVISVLVESLRSKDVFTFRNYLEFVIKPYYNKSLFNSLILSCITTSIVVIIGTIFAIFTTKTSSFLRLPIKTLGLLPLVAPPYIFSLSLILIFGRRGLLSNLLGIELSIYGWPGVIIAQVIAFLPLAYLMVENVLISGSHNLEDAAYDLGASQYRVLFTITLPLATPGLLKAFLLVFIWAIADFGNPALIGGGLPLLATDAYLLVVGENNLSMGSVFCVFLIIPSLIVFIIHKYLFRGKSYTTVIGKPQASEPKTMVPSLSIPILAITLAISLFILINFLIIFFSAFVKTLIYDHSFTLEYLIGKNSLITLKNSFKMAGIAAIFGSILSTCLSYVISRKSSAFTSTLEFVSLLGFCIPGTVIGIGYILFFNKLPFSIAPLLLMSLSTTFRNLAVGIEAGTSKLQQIDISMEEASFDLGAGKISTFLRIVMPLMKSAFFISFLFVFVEGMITVSAVIFLTAPGTNLSSLKILELVETGFVNNACGVSVLLIVSVTICLSIVNLLTRKTYRQ